MKPRTLLLHHVAYLATMTGEEIRDGALFIRGAVIEYVGSTADLPASLQDADERINMHDQVVIPGLINTHHHCFQSLTRVLPGAQNIELFGWLKTLYPLWAKLTPEMIRVATQLAMAELMLSGCTTTADHLYLYPNGSRLDDSIEGAMTMGMRFHPTRGAMSVGESQGGLPPDCLVEAEPAILRDMQRVVDAYHDSQDHAMLRIGFAPCSPFSVSRGLMAETAQLARSYALSKPGVRLHTHLAENNHDIAYTREKFHCTPTEYAESLGWLGEDVWHAHCVQLDEAGINAFARTKTGVAHCPCSNMRLASGIAPIRTMLNRGVRVGLGVDGSASNDGGNMLGEARQAMLLARVGTCNPAALTAREALHLATVGSAQVLGRQDIGTLAVGQSADVVSFALDRVNLAGADADPLAALVFCAPSTVYYSVINGKVVIREGHFAPVELPPLIAKHRQLSRTLISG